MLQNVLILPEDEPETVLSQLKSEGKRVWHHPGYVDERREVEAWVRREFIHKGGKPHLTNPLYFVLGANDEFFGKGGFFSHAHPAKLEIPLSILPSAIISFTYPDSMASLGIASDTTEQGEFFRKPFHGQVFTLEEIRGVVDEYGMPGDRWKYEERWRHDRYIEAQVWDDRPIREFIRRHVNKTIDL
jgi:hypothetical protein